MRPRTIRTLAALATAVLVGPGGTAAAGEADVLAAEVRCEDGECLFRATVRHADTGWDHYADRFEILAPDGRVLATRVLRHPHVEEQPFTRSLPGVAVAPDVREVRLRAHDSVHGHGGAEVRVTVDPDGTATSGGSASGGSPAP